MRDVHALTGWSVAALAGGGLRQESSRRLRGRAASRRRDGRHRRRRGRPRRPSRSREPTIVPPEPVRDDAIASASLDDLNRNSPLKPVFFELDSSDVEPGRTDGARRERGAAEADTPPGPSPSKDTATNAEPPSTIWHWASGARWRRAPTSSRSAFRPIGCARQLRQGIPVRSRARRSGVRQEPARAFRHHRKVSVMRQRLSSACSSWSRRRSRRVARGRRRTRNTSR